MTDSNNNPPTIVRAASKLRLRVRAAVRNFIVRSK
jgi:hypothetical protein